jgi:hypothetical protein
MSPKDKAKDKRLYKTYGITLQDWNKMYKDQGEVCWICKKLPKSGILNVDHIHQKGYKKMLPEDKKKYVRGLLCFVCNTTIGKLERRKEGCAELLAGIVRYFKVYPIKGEI